MKLCPGCHFPMSFTEIGRGQYWCNRCEGLTLAKLWAAMVQYQPDRHREFERMPVPEFDPYSYMSGHAGEILDRRRCSE